MTFAVPALYIPADLWALTWSELHRRSGGQVDAACAWAGERTSTAWTVKSVHFLDDFGAIDAGPLHHRASRASVEGLFDEMRRRGEDLIADVHTHPEDWVDLSRTDREHPLEYRLGMLAVVLPWFAATAPSLRQVGVHEYVSTATWRRLSGAEVAARFHILGPSR